MRATLVAIGVLVAGCLKPSDVACKDGRTCPSGTTCDDERGLCLTEAQTTACTAPQEGKPCTADGKPGICDRGYCEPGCGDGHTDPDEQCDDGNFASHDGCSSACVVETLQWAQVLPRWRGFYDHAAAYHDKLDRLVIFGGIDSEGVRDDIWQKNPNANPADPTGGWREVTGAFGPGMHPPARNGAAMAYDPVREVMVVYGGFDTSLAFLSDTWEYAYSTDTFEGESVGRWTNTTTATRPDALFSPQMVFDPTLGKIVLHGGLRSDASMAFSTKTWVYDGTWVELATTGAAVNSGIRAGVAFDAFRNVLVIAAGSLSGVTAELTTSTTSDWALVSSAPGSGRRQTLAMTYFPAIQKIVLFGGRFSQAGNLQPLGDTWLYNGAWQAAATTVTPSPRKLASLVADPHNNWLVLLGGLAQDGDEPFDDEWHYTATGWRVASPRFSPPAVAGAACGEVLAADGTDEVWIDSANASLNATADETWGFDGRIWQVHAAPPVARTHHSLVYDPDHNRVLLLGGYCDYSSIDDCDPLMTGAPTTAFATFVYSYDRANQSWTKLGELPADATGYRQAVFFDPSDHVVVMFGGDRDSTDSNAITRLSDTWRFDGTTWTQVSAAVHPAATDRLAVAWDPVRQATLAFDLNGVTWQFKAGTWTQLLAATPNPPADTLSTPPGRELARMVYNPWRKRFVLLGGKDASGTGLDDVWELDTAPETPTWSPLLVAGASPLPRNDFAMGMHVHSRSIVFHGGRTGNTPGRRDAWKLEYRSMTPDEDCNDPGDNDGDRQPDNEDPDCSPVPP